MGFSELLRVQTPAIRSPAWFAGLYPLKATSGFAEKMADWLARSPDQALIMCHPGQPDSDASDPIASIRGIEYNYLASAEFLSRCEAVDIVIAPFRTTES